ncbi:helix-turn-helix domain-containing protein [Nocardia sp. NPDC058058]|uniref:AlbA family DNA-binding domain-containing protein n=1 Tax=Nocardia sp. NPDC058058 TaxID=3346317 RepID=UPI0036DDD341
MNVESGSFRWSESLKTFVGQDDTSVILSNLRDDVSLDFGRCRAARISEIDAAVEVATDALVSTGARRTPITLDVAFRPAEVGVTRSHWAAGYVGDCDDILTLSRHNGEMTAGIAVIVPPSMLSNPEAVEVILLPHLARFNLRFVELKLFPHDPSSENCDVRVVPEPNSTLEDLVYAGCLLRDVVMASPSLSTSEELFARLERGEVDSLLGVAESVVLDAKRIHYLKSEVGRLELAIDVAAFANSGQGGVLAIGVRVIKDPLGREILASVEGCEIDRGAESRYRKAIDDLVFPGVDGVRMCRTESPLGEVFGIFVPRQDPERTPFIVRGGGKRDTKHSTVMFQVPVRTGDCNLPMRVEHIHSVLKSWSD